MSDPNLEDLAGAIVNLSARLDAMTWVIGALGQSHPNPAAALEVWERRRTEAADGGFETNHPAYQEKYLAELAAWTTTLNTWTRTRR